MPSPQKGESEQEYVSRFMKSKEAREDYPEEKQRAAVAYSMYRHRNNSEGWPLKFSCKFIEPGLVHYDDYGTVLVQKAALDQMASTFVGKPVINEMHKEVSPDKFEEQADGIVTDVRYDPLDGWYYADFVVWDEATKRNCTSAAYSVSCAYNVKDLISGEGSHNNIPYQQEVASGEYTHLAIVANPRYEGARIIYNSKETRGMKFWKFFGKEKKAIANDVAGKGAVIDGKQVSMKELIDTYKAEEAEKQKKQELANMDTLSEDTIVEIDGEEKTMKNLIDVYKSRHNSESKENGSMKCEVCQNDIKNDDEEKKKKEEMERKNAEEAEEKKKKDDEDRKNAEDADKKKKDEEMKNAAEAEAKKKEEELKNSEALKKAQELKNAAAHRGDPVQPQLVTRKDQAEAGAKKYGSEKK